METQKGKKLLKELQTLLQSFKIEKERLEVRKNKVDQIQKTILRKVEKLLDIDPVYSEKVDEIIKQLPQ